MSLPGSKRLRLHFRHRLVYVLLEFLLYVRTEYGIYNTFMLRAEYYILNCALSSFITDEYILLKFFLRSLRRVDKEIVYYVKTL